MSRLPCIMDSTIRTVSNVYLANQTEKASISSAAFPRGIWVKVYLLVLQLFLSFFFCLINLWTVELRCFYWVFPCDHWGTKLPFNNHSFTDQLFSRYVLTKSLLKGFVNFRRCKLGRNAFNNGLLSVLWLIECVIKSNFKGFGKTETNLEVLFISYYCFTP